MKKLLITIFVVIVLFACYYLLTVYGAIQTRWAPEHAMIPEASCMVYGIKIEFLHIEWGFKEYCGDSLMPF